MPTHILHSAPFTAQDSFRERLQAELAARCERNPGYSLRAFANSLGIDHATLSQLMRGKRSMTEATVRRLGGRIACASGADRHKVELQLDKIGLLDCFAGRIFSGHETPRSKPAPDVYLAAASALGVNPARCAVVEDTVTGAMAGVAAGATVFGYSPTDLGHSGPDALRAVGAGRPSAAAPGSLQPLRRQYERGNSRAKVLLRHSVFGRVLTN